MISKKELINEMVNIAINNYKSGELKMVGNELVVEYDSQEKIRQDLTKEFAKYFQ